MTETEIIKLVFGLFLGVGGGVLLLLAFTVGYKYLVMERRCTCRTNGTVIGYSAVSYGGEGSAVHLPVACYTVEGQEYRVTGPRYRGYVTRTASTPFAENTCRCYEKNGVLHIERSRNSFLGISQNPLAEQYPPSAQCCPFGSTRKSRGSAMCCTVPTTSGFFGCCSFSVWWSGLPAR